MPTNVMRVAASPPVAVPEPEFERMSLDRMRPVYHPFPSEWKQLRVIKKLPDDPLSLSPNDPAVVDLLYEVPGYEPDLGFTYFLRGAALAALITDPTQHENVRAILQACGERVIHGGGLPELDGTFFGDVYQITHAIFANGEPITWRPLLAFTVGCYWLLSYMQEPDKKRGKQTPRVWIKDLVLLYAELMYVPE